MLQKTEQAEVRNTSKSPSEDPNLKAASLKAKKALKDLKKVERDPVAQALYDAARFIKKKGWCRGVLYNSRGAVCLLGAIGSVTGPVRDTETRGDDIRYNLKDGVGLKAARVLFDHLLLDNLGMIANFNDNLGTCPSGTTAIKKLREVAKKYEATKARGAK